MNKHPLEPAFAKIRRSEVHIKDLNAAINAYLETRPYRLLRQLNKEQTEEVWSITVDPIPWEIECIAADAIHNLRTPMDKMLAAAFRRPNVHMTKATLKAIKFPARDTAKDFQNVLSTQKEHLIGAVMSS